MDLNARLAPLRDVDPEALSEPQLRELFPRLLAFCEEATVAILQLQADNQQLRDEIARLKGEHGGPTRPSGRGVVHPVEEPANHSSERERQTREPRPIRFNKLESYNL